MDRICSAPKCASHIVLFKLPKNDCLRFNWLRRLGVCWGTDKDIYLCSKHFAKDRFYFEETSPRLLPYSIPSFHLPGAEDGQLPSSLSLDDYVAYYYAREEHDLDSETNGMIAAYENESDFAVECIESFFSRAKLARIRKGVCIVPGCVDECNRLLRLPHPKSDELNRFPQWLKVICSRKLFELDPLEAHRKVRICLVHFSTSLFVLGEREGRLIKTAVPDSLLPDEKCLHPDYLSARDYLLEVFGENSEVLKRNNAQTGDQVSRVAIPEEIIDSMESESQEGNVPAVMLSPITEVTIYSGNEDFPQDSSECMNSLENSRRLSLADEDSSLLTEDMNISSINNEILSLDHSYVASPRKAASSKVIALDHHYQTTSKEENVMKTYESRRCSDNVKDSTEEQRNTEGPELSLTTRLHTSLPTTPSEPPIPSRESRCEPTSSQQGREVKTTATYYICIG